MDKKKEHRKILILKSKRELVFFNVHPTKFDSILMFAKDYLKRRNFGGKELSVPLFACCYSLNTTTAMLCKF